jgi:hypothetical protein
VAYDLITRQRSFGGGLPYSAYATTKVRLLPVVHDLTWVFTVSAVVAIALALWWARSDRRLLVLLGVLLALVAAAYSWALRVPLVYFRMAYYLPLVLVPLVALALHRLFRRGALAVGAALALAIAVPAWSQARHVRTFYSFLDGGSLRGLDALSSALRPHEVVVTDRCWSFLATWLLRTPTLAALEPADIQPRAEEAPARRARAILAGTPAGLRDARRLGVRYLLTDPQCTDVRGRPIRTAQTGRPAFVSRRLVILRLGGQR